MRILEDFTCECGFADELWCDSDAKYTVCPSCGEQATRQRGYPKFTLDPFSGDYPTALRNWERAHGVK